MSRLGQLQSIVKDADELHISAEMVNYSGVIEYYPEELVITVKSGTVISEIQRVLSENGQSLPFYISNKNDTIGKEYANGGQGLSDFVLGVQIIDGNGDLLNFGGQVMKNVAGYDVSRLLVGSKGKLAIITQISFKVLPDSYIGEFNQPIKSSDQSTIRLQIEKKLKEVFDPRGVFI
ncbi:MAG TPA: FAD-binding protein [Candidatus Thioglobus sp.]|jgi:glycolate oxidase FAD binding subunit|nr:FAD-binding protein [Candidatus Thioglobus sp.]HIL42083.1 FAD-binding protein [Gammaproteobacteria bacterium]